MFHQYKSPIFIDDIDINEIVGSNNFPFGKENFKFFIGYKDKKEVKLLPRFFP